MQLYSIVNKILEFILLAIMIFTLAMILIYFVREIISNSSRKSIINDYDVEKEIKRKIKKEQKKVERIKKIRTKNNNEEK